MWLKYGVDWGWVRVWWHALRGHHVGMVAKGWTCGTCGKVW